MIAYDPSDGVSATVGELEFRNAILLSEDGDTANLLLTVINLGDESKQVNVQYETQSGEKVTERVTVTGNTTVTLGSTSEPEITLDGLDAIIGSVFPVFLQYGNETGAELLMPILDGSLDEYADLVPATEAPIVLPDLPAATPSATPAA